MGSSQRGELAAKSIAPGPGNYGTTFANKNQSPRFGFGSGGRSQMAKTAGNVPGPGAYKAMEMTGKEGPVNSIHAKIEYKPIEMTGGFTPGPGAYESHHKNKKGAPSYGQGSEKRQFGAAKTVTNVPASNNYNPNLS